MPVRKTKKPIQRKPRRVTKKKNNIDNDVDKYDDLTEREHVLHRPDMYMGSVEDDEFEMWTYDEKDDKMKFGKIIMVPGLYKIYDEIIVNARDHSVMDKSCTIIKIDIDPETGEITCFNNGNRGIPIAKHKTKDVYIPEFIFSYLRSGENFKTKKKIVGGKNGLGAKLTNVWSKEFYIEVVDGKRKLKYCQEFLENMSVRGEPKITQLKGNPKSSVLVSFVPDYKRFKLEGLTNDILALFYKRAYDIAACTRKNVKVYLNGKLLKVKNFENYITMFCTEGDGYSEPIYREINNRWRVGVVYNDKKYQHISYVNGICTYHGGTHVNYVTKQIIDGISEIIKKKHKNVNVRYNYIKDKLTFFIDSVIEDPSFNSQIKEYLNTKRVKFGSTCEIKDEFIKEIAKTGIVDSVVALAKFKTQSDLEKKTNGKKTKKIRGLALLEDAKYAGTRNAHKCSLFITEGNSAKAFAMNGLEIIGREYHGVFPLKGKLLNVRDAPPQKIYHNKEVQNLKTIIGLQNNVDYVDVKKLRYGSIIILTDQDHDGFHIKGLIMNLFDKHWRSLIKIPGFIKSMITPIVKVFKKTDTKKMNPTIFYNLIDYENWVKKMGSRVKQWTPKYYKGLGTSTNREAKEVFKDYPNCLRTYVWEGDISAQSLDKGFSKKRAKDRKVWITNFDPQDDKVDNDNKNVSYSDFINKELIQFSYADVIRSIPFIIDGFKPSHRKVLYACILANIFKKEMKVSQLSGTVSEKTAYHHGEASLNGTIIGMAQNYVGSNNINLLHPQGQFGDRMELGKNHASPRYIYTRIGTITPFIYKKDDNPVLKHNLDDNKKIEYENFAPIIPMILVNGTLGIGTGWSSFIPNHNPIEIIENVERWIDEKPLVDLRPYYKNFKGKIVKLNKNTYRSKGIYEIISPTTVVITELPIGLSTLKYKQILEKLEINEILEFENESTANKIYFKIKFPRGQIQKLTHSGELENVLKIHQNIPLTNMHLIDVNGVVKKYNNVKEIINEFCEYRLDIYVKRREHKLVDLENQMLILKYKKMFIEDYLKTKIVLHGKTEKQVEKRLETLKYPKLSQDPYANETKKNYNYLTSLRIITLTKDNKKKLDDEYKQKKQRYDEYNNMTAEDIWYNELHELKEFYKIWLKEQEEFEGIEEIKKPRRRRVTRKRN